MLKDLAPFVPLASTLLWVLLIIGLAIWLRWPIRSVLSAIQKRIETGSTVKAGWFELSDQLRPQSAEEQREVARVAIAEGSAAGSAHVAGTGVAIRADAASRYLQSEDLALRAVQAEFEVPLSRQVVHSSGTRFDAVFVKDRRVFVVEVKSFVAGVNTAGLRSSLMRVVGAAREMGGSEATLIVALVLEGSEEARAIRARAEEELRSLPLKVILRVYSLGELRSLFGAAGGDA